LRAALLGLLALAGCATGLSLQDHPLAGKIWDAKAATFVSEEQVLRRTLAAHYVLLGETHDNREHHRLQRFVLQALARQGPARQLAMEQFDAEHQQSIDAARERDGDAEAIAQAGRFDPAGWNWPLYRPLVELALAHRWPLVAANLSRQHARAIALDPARSGLPPPDSRLREALERDMIAGHCGARPEPRRLAGLVEAQRARDAQMARSLSGRSGVLIAGNGHVRKDRGMPLHLDGADVVAIGLVEVEAGKKRPQEYWADGFATESSYDYVWFTARAEREDPCASFKRGSGQPKTL